MAADVPLLHLEADMVAVTGAVVAEAVVVVMVAPGGDQGPIHQGGAAVPTVAAEAGLLHHAATDVDQDLLTGVPFEKAFAVTPKQV